MQPNFKRKQNRYFNYFGCEQKIILNNNKTKEFDDSQT